MTTFNPRIGTLVAIALALVVSWPMSLSAEEAELQTKSVSQS